VGGVICVLAAFKGNGAHSVCTISKAINLDEKCIDIVAIIQQLAKMKNLIAQCFVLA
jgi:hypothetical protein